MLPLYSAVGTSEPVLRHGWDNRLRQIVLSDAALRHKTHNCLGSPHAKASFLWGPRKLPCGEGYSNLSSASTGGRSFFNLSSMSAEVLYVATPMGRL